MAVERGSGKTARQPAAIRKLQCELNDTSRIAALDELVGKPQACRRRSAKLDQCWLVKDSGAIGTSHQTKTKYAVG